jgi:hypothetical protein
VRCRVSYLRDWLTPALRGNARTTTNPTDVPLPDGALSDDDDWQPATHPVRRLAAVIIEAADEIDSWVGARAPSCERCGSTEGIRALIDIGRSELLCSTCMPADAR